MDSMNVHRSGRSGARIIEDLLRLVPKQHSMLKSGIEMAKIVDPRAINTLYYLDPSPEPPSIESVDGTCCSFYCIFANNLHHLELHISRNTAISSLGTEWNAAIYDFHLDLDNSVCDEISGQERYVFQCSQTFTNLEIIIRPPEFTDLEISDFSDSKIRKRCNSLIGHDSQIKIPTPTQCYLTLYKIIEQPLSSTEPKEMKADNGTLNMRLNRNLLPKLGFKLDKSRNSYVPPDLHDYSDTETIYKRRAAQRKLLETAVRAVMSSTRSTLFKFNLEPAVRLFRSNLGCTDYYFNDNRDPMASAADVYGNYVILGAGEKEGDEALIERYELQLANDNTNSTTYFDALRNIAEVRNSEKLQIKVMELMSLGAVALSDVDRAYAKFNLEPRSEFDPEVLIQMYTDAIKNDSPSEKAVRREALNVIATTTNDRKLQDFLSTDGMTLETAYSLLEVTADQADTVIGVMAEMKMQENDNKTRNQQALLTIAKERNSYRLFDILETWMALDDSLPQMSIDSAYELLGVDSTVDEDNIVAVFEIRLKDAPNEVINLRTAVRTISQVRKSQTLANYLYTGSTTNVPEEVKQQGDSKWPVGLNNIGNTCYLNSLLQFYFTLTPLREAVVSFRASQDIGGDKKRIVKKVGGRDVPVWEVARSQEFVTSLGELFHELIHTDKKSVSPTKDLAYLALIPSSDEPEENLEIVIEKEESSCYSEDDDVKVLSVRKNEDNQEEYETDIEEGDFSMEEGRQEPELIELDSPMAIDDENKENEPVLHFRPSIQIPHAPPRISTTKRAKRRKSSIAIAASGEEKTRRIDNALMGRQQDVAECIDNVLFQIEAAFQPTGPSEDGEQTDIIKQLFYGSTKQVLASAEDGSGRREKVERFNNLLVDVAEGPRDIYGALDAAFKEQLFDLEEGKTLRTMEIQKLPPILQIQVQRVQYDRVLHRPFKSLATLSFDKVIYMDRYLASDDFSLMEKRRQVNQWRQELDETKAALESHLTRQSNNITMVENLTILKTYFSGLEDDHPMKPKPSTIDVLEQEIIRLNQLQTDLESRISSLNNNINTIFNDLKTEAYKLHSVFIHRGQASFGHYWIYIYDHHDGIFRKYNDETITEANEEQIFDMEPNNTATPYFLVYVKEELYVEYTRCVVREIGTDIKTETAT